MKIAVLYSGGMDSRILWHLAERLYPNSDRTATYWSHGHPQDWYERGALPSFVQIRNCDWLNLHVAGAMQGKPDDPNDPIYIPGRNLAFAVLTACQELPDEVWLGALANEQGAGCTDKNPVFCDAASVTLSWVLRPFVPKGVVVRCPLAEAGLDKFGAAQWAVSNGLKIEDLACTWSCRNFHPWGVDRSLPCGNCDQCIRRFAVFTGLGNPVAEHYATTPLDPGKGRDWLIRLYRTASEHNWIGPAADDCAMFMTNLAPYIGNSPAFRQDEELQQVARLMRNQP
jgi:7-cyano-7-deazaguanine synthase in queuosine biosynthesis